MKRRVQRILRQLSLFEQGATDTAPRPRRMGTRSGKEDEALTQEASQLLASIGEAELADAVCIEWYPRLRSTAGMAARNTPTVYLNPRLLEFAPEEPGRTLRHELAHLVAHRRAGRRRIAPHGREWQQACSDLGIPGERATHQLPFPRVRHKRPHVYTCPECAERIERTRPFRRAVACFACCRKHNGGGYDERFRLKKEKVVKE